MVDLTVWGSMGAARAWHAAPTTRYASSAKTQSRCSGGGAPSAPPPPVLSRLRRFPNLGIDPKVGPGGSGYARAFCLSASNSACVMAPLSSSCFPFSISPVAPPLAAVERT